MVNCLILFHYLFLGFLMFSQLKDFWFSLTFSSLNLTETVNHCYLLWSWMCALCGNFPTYRLYTRVRWRQLKFDVVTSHIFPQGVWLLSPRWLMMEAGACTRCETGFLSQCRDHHVSGRGSASFQVFPSSHTGAFALKEEVLKQVGFMHLLKVQCSVCISTCGSAQRKYMVASFSLLWLFQI